MFTDFDKTDDSLIEWRLGPTHFYSDTQYMNQPFNLYMRKLADISIYTPLA